MIYIRMYNTAHFSAINFFLKFESCRTQNNVDQRNYFEKRNSVQNFKHWITSKNLFILKMHSIETGQKLISEVENVYSNFYFRKL